MSRIPPTPLGGLALFLLLRGLFAAQIELPPETNAFKQEQGAEIANAQCLICHSVEYVAMQPPLARSGWKASVQKMQQKYKAAIPEAQVEPLVDYLTRNYGTNGNQQPVPAPAQNPGPPAAVGPDATQVAAKYGCLGCHNVSTKIIGPPYREIASKYKGDSEAAQKIQQQIQHGGSGKWGPIIMPPFPQVTAAETKVLTDWILGLK